MKEAVYKSYDELSVMLNVEMVKNIEYTDIYTKDGKKLNGNLMYTIRPIQEAVDYELEKLFEKKELKH